VTAKKIRDWRLSQAEPHGLLVWFDPYREDIMLRDLTDEERSVRLDTQVSVSALIGSDQLEQYSIMTHLEGDPDGS